MQERELSQTKLIQRVHNDM